MTRLKRWESPRSGPQRNRKGRGGSKRLRQIKKRNQMMVQALKASNAQPSKSQKSKSRKSKRSSEASLDGLSSQEFIMQEQPTQLSMIVEALEGGSYRAIYCDRDTEPDRCLPILNQHYTASESIDALFKEGDLDRLAETLETCTFCARDRYAFKANTVQLELENFDQLVDSAHGIFGGDEVAYVYLFQNGSWKYVEGTKLVSPIFLTQWLPIEEATAEAIATESVKETGASTTTEDSLTAIATVLTSVQSELVPVSEALERLTNGATVNETTADETTANTNEPAAEQESDAAAETLAIFYALVGAGLQARAMRWYWEQVFDSRKKELVEFIDQHPNSGLPLDEKITVAGGEFLKTSQTRYVLTDTDALISMVTTGTLTIEMLLRLAFPKGQISNPELMWAVLGEETFAKITRSTETPTYIFKPSDRLKDEATLQFATLAEVITEGDRQEVATHETHEVVTVI